MSTAMQSDPVLAERPHVDVRLFDDGTGDAILEFSTGTNLTPMIRMLEALRTSVPGTIRNLGTFEGIDIEPGVDVVIVVSSDDFLGMRRVPRDDESSRAFRWICRPDDWDWFLELVEEIHYSRIGGTQFLHPDVIQDVDVIVMGPGGGSGGARSENSAHDP